MPVQKFVSKEEIAKALNITVEEVDDMVFRKQIPHHIRLIDGEKKLLFPLQEVLSTIKPKPSRPKRTRRTAR